MKKVFIYILLILTWFNNGLAKNYSLIDLKIGDNILKYFNTEQINKFYIKDAEKSPSGERVFGKDLKYSFLAIKDSEEVFKKEYDFFQIYYENSSNKIVSISGTDKSKDIESCLKTRDNNVSKYKNKNKITSLFNKHDSKDEYSNGLKTDNISFMGPTKIFTFACYEWSSDDIEYSLTIYENEFNDFLYEKMQQ